MGFVMEIEKPDYYNIFDYSERTSRVKFNDWFDKEVEPINKLLREGVEVYTTFENGKEKYCWSRNNLNQFGKHTHKALLIGITETKRETPSDVLKEMLDAMERGDEPGYNLDWYKRGRKALKGKK